jgi:hypothetical protein
MSREQDLLKALNRAAFALFQIKRMNPDAIREFAANEHAAACSVIDNEEVQSYLDSLVSSYQLGSANRGGEGG